MYEIETHEMSDDFFPCWKAAGIHLSNQVDEGIRSWLRAHPYPPFLEHLSFRLGNQLFFVRVEDVDGAIQGPGNISGLATVAQEANGFACILPMKKSGGGREWKAYLPDWGLVELTTREPINPVSLVTAENIEMTSWEIHDMAVQVVRDRLVKQGFELRSWQSNPKVDPSIWFIGTTGKPEWVVVRSAKYPSTIASRPRNWDAISKSCARISDVGHFAMVAIANADQTVQPRDEFIMPLLRGHGMNVRFEGLELNE
jgi:hypothetical protein